jgi:nucleotide-binding universal stress UspA family protein
VSSVSQGPAPIVVGVDADEASLAALRWAADEARAHGAAVIAVHVLEPREDNSAPYAWPDDPGDVRDLEQRAAIERQISAAGVPEAQRVFEAGVPSQILVRHAAGARMLVLGHADAQRRGGGRGGKGGAALGSITRACLIAAPCPVVVVPVPVRRAERGPAPYGPLLAAERESPLTGGRALYPAHQRIPLGHG